MNFFNDISEKYLHFIKKQKNVWRKIFRPLLASNRIYVIPNYSSNYVYLEDRYKTLKGIGKIVSIWVDNFTKSVNFSVLKFPKVT